MKKTVLSMLLVACGWSLMLLSCGGDDSQLTSFGIDQTVYLDEMNTSEKQSFCEWYVELFGGEGKQYNCTDDQEDSSGDMQGETIDIPSVSSCLEMSQMDSHCQLQDLDSCFSATGGDVCKVATIDECSSVRDCLAGVGSDNAPNNWCDDSTVRCYCNEGDYDSGKDPLGAVFVSSCWSWFKCSPYNCSHTEYWMHDKCDASGLCDKCDFKMCRYVVYTTVPWTFFE